MTRMKLRTLFPVALIGLAATSPALVSLEFRPLVQTVNLGDTISVELWATTNQGTEEFVAVDVILLWTESIMNPISAHQGGGAFNNWTASGFFSNEMNQSLSDGNAFWTGLGSLFGGLPEATTAGLHLTTFTFQATALGTATLAMPATYQWPNRPQPFESKVYGPQNMDITGNLADTATIHVVPEPATIAALGLGAAALLRRRRRQA
jgi:hypothetical protein